MRTHLLEFGGIVTLDMREEHLFDSGMGTMSIPDHTGHTTRCWTSDDAASVASAKSTFSALLAQRLVPFARSVPAHRPTTDFEQIREFDPAADEIMWVRPLQGG